MTKQICAKALWIAACAAGAAALAHHSFAMFDATQTMTLEGTLKKAELINPHSWYWVTVPDADGGSELWGAEGGGPANATASAKAAGMPIKDYFAPGQKVTMTLHPLRDGRKGGQLITLKFEDGRTFGENTTTNPAPAPTPAPGG